MEQDINENFHAHHMDGEKACQSSMESRLVVARNASDKVLTEPLTVFSKFGVYCEAGKQSKFNDQLEDEHWRLERQQQLD